MNNRKRDDTFKVYQEENQSRRENIIRAWLYEAQATRTKYDYLTDLAKAVAKHIAQIEQGDCSASTLLRNKRYKTLLLRYMENSMLGVKVQRDSNRFGNAATPLALTYSQLETSNVRQENQRLKAYIVDLESQISEPKDAVYLHADQSAKKNGVDELVEVREKYILTCQTLLLVLERRRDVLEIDQEKRQIIDSSMLRGNKIIADALLSGPFFQWYKANQASRG